MATQTAVDVVMPQMGVSVSEGTITKWNKQVGDTIEADETLLEISTDKVDTEVPSPASGVVSEILVQEGETVDVGTAAGAHRRRGRRLCARSARTRAGDPARRRGRQRACKRRRRVPRRTRSRSHLRPRPSSAPSGAENGKSFVSPVVARIAAEHGIDPSQVPGSGSGGRVTKKDIQAFIDGGGQTPRLPRRPHRPAPAPAAAPAPPAPAQVAQAPAAAGEPGSERRSSRCRRCAAGSPTTCASRSTPPRT